MTIPNESIVLRSNLTDASKRIKKPRLTRLEIEELLNCFKKCIDSPESGQA